ncbi:MAG: phage tail assembly chaperone [Tepidisphaeraceae bacterium]
MLNAESILASADLPTESVEVPEWNGTVYVRTMSGTDRDAFEASMIDTKKPAENGKPAGNLKNIRARLCVLTVCDQNGNRLFTDDQADALGAKSSKALDRVFEVAQRLNGLGAKDVEALQGN